jgi:hypothetical protein
MAAPAGACAAQPRLLVRQLHRYPVFAANRFPRPAV